MTPALRQEIMNAVSPTPEKGDPEYNDWFDIFEIISVHTIWTPTHRTDIDGVSRQGERQCIACGPTNEGGQAHIARYVLAYIKSKEIVVVKQANASELKRTGGSENLFK